jgi:hypothetical protein
MPTGIPPSPKQPPPPVPGEALTRRAVTAITAVIAVMAFAFSLDNVANLCMTLGIKSWNAWLVGPAVDLSVVGLLSGVQFLSQHGFADDQLRKPRFMLWFCGLLTLALNTAGAVAHRQFGTALVDAVGPALLIGWSEVGPWLLRQIYSVCAIATPTLAKAAARPELPLVLPARLLAQARDLDEAHRAVTGGRPISRDKLRAELRIGRDRASALIAAIRAETPAAEPLAA